MASDEDTPGLKTPADARSVSTLLPSRWAMRVVWFVAGLATVLVIGRALLTPAPAPAPSASTAGTPLPPAGLVGHLAPEATLQGMNGQVVKLSSYRGQIVILNFWYVACEPCRYEMPIFERVYHADASQHVVVLGVNITDDAGTINAFTHTLGIDYPILRDTAQQAVLGYNVTVTPTTFIIDRQGVIRAKLPGAITDSQTLNRAISPLLAAP